MRGNQKKRTYWVVVDAVDLNVCDLNLWTSRERAASAMQGYQENDYKKAKLKIMRVTIMGKPENWK